MTESRPSAEPATTPRRRRRAPLVTFAGFTGILALGGATYVDPLYQAPDVRAALPAVEERVSGSVRVLTLNAAHGRGTGFHQVMTRPDHIRRNLDAIAELILATDADVVALQELDAPSAWSGRFDHLEYLAQRTGYAHTFHGLHVTRRRPRLAYGTGVLSRFPIARGRSRRFGRNVLDTKGYVLARVEAPGGPLDVVSVHLDFKRDSERRAQLELLSRQLGVRRDAVPLVVAGDFNCALGDRDGIMSWFIGAHTLTAFDGEGGTFPARRPRRRIDYVLVSEELQFSQRRVLPVLVSDHLPVLAEVIRRNGAAR